MDTDMIGIDSAEEMRKKIQAKIKEEKEKNVKGIINIRIKTITDANCISVLIGLYDKCENHYDTLNDYEKKYYSNMFGNLTDLICMLFEEKLMKKTKEEIIKEYIEDSMDGVNSLEDLDEDDQINHCIDYDANILAPCLVRYMTDILNKTDV